MIMSNRFIKMHDNIAASDNRGFGGLRGEVIFGTGRHDVEFKDPYGNYTVRSEFDKILYRDHNIVPIGAYQFAFDKLFNIGLDAVSTLRVGDLNDEAPMMNIGVPRANYKSTEYKSETNGTNSIDGVNISALNYIFGFMIGDGGAREDNITAIAPDYKNRSLYRAIPFRIGEIGNNDIDETKYFGKITSGGNVSYYIKKFDAPEPRIIHAWVSNNSQELDIVDDTVFSSTSSIPIESYVEINFSVSAKDGRGFGDTATSRVNEFALVSGWYNSEANDYEALRIFTHFTRPSISLGVGDSIEAIYRLYAR